MDQLICASYYFIFLHLYNMWSNLSVRRLSPMIFTEGDYNVIIPATTAAGFYVIRVGLFGEDSVYGCSEPFEVVAPGDELWN